MNEALEELNRRSLAMITAFIRGTTPREKLRNEAEAIMKALDDIDLGSRRGAERKRLQRLIGEARIESRHVLSDGEGPRSLRAGKIR